MLAFQACDPGSIPGQRIFASLYAKSAKMTQCYNFSVFIPSKSEQIYKLKISNFDEFIQALGKFDKKFNIFDFQLILFKENVENKWEDPANKRGARFIIFFPSDILAVRTFCLLSYFWITKSFKFASNIVGIYSTVKQRKSSIQIWVDDGFDTKNLSERYSYLVDWMKNVAGINEDQVMIHYLLHPNYRVYRTGSSSTKQLSLKNELRVQAIQIPSFQYCISRLKSGESISPTREPKFNLEVATTYKRSRKERRANPSYVDNITKG